MKNSIKKSLFLNKETIIQLDNEKAKSLLGGLDLDDAGNKSCRGKKCGTHCNTKQPGC